MMKTKVIWSWGDISSVIMIIFAWGSTLMLPMSGKSIAGNSVIFEKILLVAISIYNRLQDKEEMSGYTNTPQSGIILKPVF